jgi:hypothetical protein
MSQEAPPASPAEPPTNQDQPHPRPIDQYTPREKLAALIARCETDPSGAGMVVRADPIAALQSVGFSQGQAQSLTAPAAQADDPVAALGAGCNDTSCAISLCPPTCFVTIPAIPGICKEGCTWFSL